MRTLAVAAAASALLLVLVLLPGVLASPSGSVTTCSGFGDCHFTIKNSKGTGWANTTGSAIAFQLPGEAKATYGVPYSYTGAGLYSGTYDIKGSFAGTDVNTNKVVYGTTNVNLTVTVHCQRGCWDTWTVNSGNITFHLTKADQTSVAFSCSPSSFTAGNGNHSVCTATVSDVANSALTPNGTVQFTARVSGYGHFSNNGTCSLSSGSCSVKFTPNADTQATVTLYAHFKGNCWFYQSYATTYLYITAQG